MVVSILLYALIGASTLSLVVLLMGGSILQVLIVYFLSSSVIALGIGVLRAYFVAAKNKKPD